MKNFPVLSQTFVFNQIKNLIDGGHHVDIFSDHIHDISLFREDIVRYHLMERCYRISSPETLFRKLSSTFTIIFGMSPLTPRQSIKALLGRRPGFRFSFNDLFASQTVASQSQYDIFICHFGQEGLRGAFYKSIGVTKARIVTFFHGLDMSLFLKIYGNNVYKRLFSSGDLFLPISDFWNEKLIGLGCPPDKTITHKMGVDTTKFHFSYREVNPESPFTLISVSRLVEKKGLEYAVHAVAILISEGLNVYYEIIGDGEYRKKLQQLIDNLKINDRVKISGSIRHDEVAARISAADIFMLPSVTAQNGDMEGIPVVLMEAMALGVPVLTSHHSGIPELVKDGETGVLVPERDEGAISRKLKMLLFDRNLHRKVSYNARQFVEKHHNEETLHKAFNHMITSR